MASRLTSLKFDQAANLVDDPANPKAKIVLFKRAKGGVELGDNERRSRVQAAAQDRWGNAKNNDYVWVQDLVGDLAIIQRDGKLCGVPFVIDAKGTVSFTGEGDPVAATYEVLKSVANHFEVVKRLVRKDQPSIGAVHVDSPDWKVKEAAYFKAAAERTAAAQNDLPDGAFAVIEPGGTKDDTGKTTPRSLRHLPYKDKNLKIDLPHLRNALARLSQTSLSDSLKAEAKTKLDAAARNAGIGDAASKAKPAWLAKEADIHFVAGGPGSGGGLRVKAPVAMPRRVISPTIPHLARSAS